MTTKARAAAVPTGARRAELLRKVIAKRQLPTPLNPCGPFLGSKGALFAKLGPIAGAGEQAALALIDLALALGRWPDCHRDRRAIDRARVEHADGNDARRRRRATTPVVLELLANAKQRVVIAGYQLDYGAVLFQLAARSE